MLGAVRAASLLAWGTAGAVPIVRNADFEGATFATGPRNARPPGPAARRAPLTGPSGTIRATMPPNRRPATSVAVSR